MIRTALAVSILTLACAGSAQASTTCKLSLTQQRHAGATYLVQLKASGTTCANALKVEKAWQSCRRATAGKTTCKKSVLGYRSTQKILDSSKTQYDAKVTAKSGSRLVSFIYTQNK